MADFMKAYRKSQAGPGFELIETRVPQPGAGQALMKVIANSICGTDVHIFEWNQWAADRIKPPLIMGHEFVGEVVEVGPGKQRVKPGDRVTAESHIVCGRCYQCLSGNAHVCSEFKIIGVDCDGCFSEYVVLPQENLFVVDSTIPITLASIQEPMGNAVHTALATDVIGKNVLVIGCGPIGCGAVAIVKACGASRVFATDLNRYRLNLASQMGADLTGSYVGNDLVEWVKDNTGGRGVDVVLEMSGSHQALRDSLVALANGGHLVILGVPSGDVSLDVAEGIVFKGITVHGITGRRLFDTWLKTEAFMESGEVDFTPLITHVLDFKDMKKGMELMMSGQSGKIVLLH